jgi:hypothetical protein
MTPPAASRTAVALPFLFLLAGSASAQEMPRVGLVLGYPPQAAVLLTLSDRVSVRPEITWSRSTFEATTTVITFGAGIPAPITTSRLTTSDATAVGIGVSGLFYLSSRDGLRTYVAPRVGYTRTRSTNDLGGVALDLRETGPVTTVASSYGAAGSVGAQYTLGSRFAVFGELGVGYSRSGRPSSSAPLISDDNVTSTSTAVRSSAGVILFF